MSAIFIKTSFFIPVHCKQLLNIRQRIRFLKSSVRIPFMVRDHWV
ncbi:hypothetical protein EfmU0317_2390 [Enterococcus faecium U0317]|nr:hypothetical protein EfmU0317_2390 [Enterococcus faecium U0317]